MAFVDAQDAIGYAQGVLSEQNDHLCHSNTLQAAHQMQCQTAYGKAYPVSWQHLSVRGVQLIDTGQDTAGADRRVMAWCPTSVCGRLAGVRGWHVRQCGVQAWGSHQKLQLLAS